MAAINESSVIAGVYVVDPDIRGDDRGMFVETYRRQWFPDGGEMVQANRSDRRVGAVVGLHYHCFQSDYWYVPRGRARVVLHDLRQSSTTDGATLILDIGHDPDDDDGPDFSHHRGVLIPPGVAHGFAALSDMTMTYLVDRYYDPEDELGVAWDDPAIGADWGVSDPVLSERDRTNPTRDQLEKRP